jgi:hypothetical protein
MTANTDRANLRVIDTQTGEKTLLTPSSGAGYNTLYDDLLLCDGIGRLRGWSGNFTTWRQSSFNLATYAGKEIRLEARYSSDDDGSLLPQGFWMDLVQLTNATQITCDEQPDSCAPLPPEVSPPGDPVAFTLGKSGSDLALVFSESAGAASYNVYRGSIASLRQGIYDHAQAVGLCGIIDGISGNGVVAATVPGASVPDDSYVLAVARNGAGESRYGTKSGGAELPLALSACP